MHSTNTSTNAAVAAATPITTPGLAEAWRQDTTEHVHHVWRP